MAMNNFRIHKTYTFRYDLYVKAMAYKGYPANKEYKIHDGQSFVSQNNSNYVVLRSGLNRITVSPKMCECK